MTDLTRVMSMFKVLAMAGTVCIAAAAGAAPVVSQVGNLLTNGNFESGTAGTRIGNGSSAFTGWNQYANNGPVTSTWAASPVVDGNHSALLTGNVNDGLYQYQFLNGGTYTLSGWVFVESGSVHLGLAWNGGSNAAFGAAQGVTGDWEYVSFTQTIAASTAGALVYGAGLNGRYYVDGLWLNAGSTSTSLYDPSRGFNPKNSTGLPEPGALALAGLGLIALTICRAARRPGLRRAL